MPRPGAEGVLDTVGTERVGCGWKQVTFEMDLPFEPVGFLAPVATVLARADVSAFVRLSYSSDHVFVKQADLATATSRLESLDCTVAEVQSVDGNLAVRDADV